MKKIKRLIVTLLFPKTIAVLSFILALLIAITILEFIPAVFGLTLAVIMICVVAAGLLIIIFKPVLAMHALIWVLNHTVYNIKAVGHENIPKVGGALLVSNSVSYIDTVIIFSAIKRPIKFFVGKEFSDHPFLKPFLDESNSIPIDAKNPKIIARALKEARRSIQNGELVCIFAEGDLTRTGNMLAFRKGYEVIVRDLKEPIIPIHLDRIWGSTFSFVDRRLKWRFPGFIPYPVTVSIGKPMPSSSDPFEVRLAVQELSAAAFKLRGDKQKKLHIGFIQQVRKHPFKFCFGDLTNKLNYLQTFVFAVGMSRRIGKTKDFDEKVGIFLPTSIAAATANIAISMAGKIPVNLNFTSSKETLAECIKQCDMKQIISARPFLDKLNMHHFDDMMIYAEDIKADIKPFEKIKIILATLLLPSKLLVKLFVKGNTKNLDDIATIVFSSGSTGEPKGVMLTHQNVVSNIEAAYKIIGIKDDDIIAGILPIFHSFGYTATLWLAAYYGIGIAFHASPVEAQSVGDMIQKFKCTVIFATPTFLNAYTRKCTSEQFKSLKTVVAGAEKLKKAISKTFHEKFEKTVFEGYGTTELSPIVSLCIPSYVDPKTHKVQVGHKFGTVGHPLPGVAAKIVDPDTFELLPFGKEGMLLIKGPNVMKGYLNNPQKTAEVIKDGWYVTGDIAIIDEDGFIAITDRLSRFSKIGGEMVPQIRIEEEIQNAAEEDEHFVIVVGVPDEKRGERLIALYKGERDIDKIINKLQERDLPNLWIPKKENFYKVEEFPVLGNGKLDFKGIKKLAQELYENK